jgi:hypothetical protein
MVQKNLGILLNDGLIGSNTDSDTPRLVVRLNCPEVITGIVGAP